MRKEREGDWGWWEGEEGEGDGEGRREEVGGGRKEERTLFPTSSMSVVYIFSSHLISACGVNQKTAV